MKKGETRETGTGGTQKARRGNRWERNLEGDGRWSGRGEACRNGMRADDVGALEEGRGEAGKGGCVEGRTRRPFPAGLSASATDKSRGFGGNYFPRRGVGRSPAYQTHPAKPNRPRAVQKRAWRRGTRRPFPRRSFQHLLRTNQGGSGEIISPGGGVGRSPRITKPIPAKPNRPRAVQKRAWRRGTRRPFPAGLSASATDKSRGLGGNYFPRRGAGRSPA